VVLPALIERHRDEILRIAAHHGASDVRLFGSFARGKQREQSDVDLLVRAGSRTSSWFPAGLIVDLEDLLGRPVQVVTERALHPFIREQVLREARSL
jgi:predicted nucleotidyltransferase